MSTAKWQNIAGSKKFFRFLTHSVTFEPNSFHFGGKMPPKVNTLEIAAPRANGFHSNIFSYGKCRQLQQQILIWSKFFYFRNCCTWISSWTPNGFNSINPVDSKNNSSSKVCSPNAFTKKQSRILNFQKLYCLIFFPGFELVMLPTAHQLSVQRKNWTLNFTILLMQVNNNTVFNGFDRLFSYSNVLGIS